MLKQMNSETGHQVAEFAQSLQDILTETIQEPDQTAELQADPRVASLLDNINAMIETGPFTICHHVRETFEPMLDVLEDIAIQRSIPTFQDGTFAAFLEPRQKTDQICAAFELFECILEPEFRSIGDKRRNRQQFDQDMVETIADVRQVLNFRSSPMGVENVGSTDSMADCVAAILASPQTRPDGSDSSAAATDVVEEYIWFTMSETADILYNLADQRDACVANDIAHPIQHIIEIDAQAFVQEVETHFEFYPNVDTTRTKLIAQCARHEARRRIQPCIDILTSFSKRIALCTPA